MDWEAYVTQLWTERLVWVRQLIISQMLSLRDFPFVAQRLQRNDAELGQILGSVFGFEAGQRFEELLGQYIRNLNEVASTVKSGNDPALLIQQWYSSANEIGEFASQINPYWEKSAVESLIDDEIGLEFDLLSGLKNDEFTRVVSNFDPALDKALEAARFMISGIKMYLGLQGADEPTES